MKGFNGRNCENSKQKNKNKTKKLMRTILVSGQIKSLLCKNKNNLLVCFNNKILDINECEVRPCKNNGTCVDLVNGYQCFCTNAFSGIDCANDKKNVFIYNILKHIFKCRS